MANKELLAKVDIFIDVNNKMHENFSIFAHFVMFGAQKQPFYFFVVVFFVVFAAGFLLSDAGSSTSGLMILTSSTVKIKVEKGLICPA